MYSMTPKNFFCAYEYQKYAVFYADSKSIEIIAESALRKRYLPNMQIVRIFSTVSKSR
jgi:hypothetical protein